MRDALMVRRQGGGIRWYEVYSNNRDAYIDPRDGEWWDQMWWRWVAGPAYSLLIWLGFWEVQEGDWFTSGRWHWGDAPYSKIVRQHFTGVRGFWRFVVGRWG